MALTRRTSRPLVLPIGDKDYAVPPTPADEGWQLVELLNKSIEETDKAEGTAEELFRLALGQVVYDELIADGVSFGLRWLAGMAALAHFKSLIDDPYNDDVAHEAAAVVWESKLDPEALAAFVAATTGQNSTDSPPSSSTAGASATRSRASSSTTTSRRTSSRTPRKTKPSAGRNSSRNAS